MRVPKVLTALLFFPGAPFGAATTDMCTTNTCKAGTQAVTYATKEEPHYSCPTREPADYSSFVLGLTAMDAMMGVFPNISDKTGEPETKDQIKNMMDTLRTAAHVSSFDEAIALCHSGKKGRKALVINVPEDALLAVYVHDLKSNMNYWMPIGSLDKKP